MTSELINVPEGYKIALARFNAMANTGDFSANPGNVTRLARGGIVTRPTFALVGEAGPEAVVPLSSVSSNGASSIHIETLIIQTDNIEDLQRQLEQVASRNAFMGRGTPMRTNKFRG